MEQVEVESYTLEEILTSLENQNRLILWNDDHNTFDHVIYCLITHLSYTESQAERIAWSVHTKGKCTILEGDLTKLGQYRSILLDEGLTVSIS